MVQRSHGFNCQLPAGKGHMEPATEQRAWVRCPYLPSAVFPAAAGDSGGTDDCESTEGSPQRHILHRLLDGGARQKWEGGESKGGRVEGSLPPAPHPSYSIWEMGLSGGFRH